MIVHVKTYKCHDDTRLVVDCGKVPRCLDESCFLSEPENAYYDDEDAFH